MTYSRIYEMIKFSEGIRAGTPWHIDKGGDGMRVTLIWEHGILTRLQSANALKIALKWLYKYDDLLSVFCTTTQTMYIKEGRE